MNICARKVQKVNFSSSPSILPSNIEFTSIHLGCCIFHKKKDVCESDSDESASDIEEAEKSDANPEKPRPFQIHHA